jgi:hypothetical protein
MPRLFAANRMEESFPIVDILRQTPEIPPDSQWAIFLRNHDELTLETVTSEERDYMYRTYAQDPQARINLGIRRRLAPLLENDRRRIELMNALLLSLPGTPVIYYGDEIGMGDNVYLGDRNGVRTPMQWSPDRNAGFSRANPQRLYLPVNIDPQYHYEAVNVETQQQSGHSLLRWMRRAIAVRKQFKAFGSGAMELLTTDNHRVLAFLRRHGDERILVLANLSRFVQPVGLDLREFQGLTPVEMLGRSELAPVTDAARKDLSAIKLNADRLLHRTCGDVSGTKVDALWRPILECVSSQQPVVPIFTLNYDWTFEKLAIENQQRYHLTDGFELLGGNWDAERFAKMRPSRKKVNLALFKLHGSTCWLAGMKSTGSFETRTRDDFGDDYPTRPFDMVYPGHAHEMSLGKEYWDRASDPHGMQWPWLEQDPYKTIYAQLHQAAKRANISTRTLWRLVSAGHLKTIKVSKRRRIVMESELSRYLSEGLRAA